MKEEVTMDFDAIHDLLKKVGKLQKEQGVFLERMEKLKDKTGSISEAVYQNIQSDYRKKLDHLNTELYPLYDQLKVRKSELTKEISEIEEALKEFRMEKEEIMVRSELGEYDEKKAEKMIAELEAANEDKFERLKELKDILGKVEDALSAECNSDAVPEMAGGDVRVEDMQELADISPEDEETPEPVEAEDVDDTEDTMSETASVPPPPPAAGDNVDRTVLDMEAVDAEGGSTVLFRPPTLVITEGDMAGTEFRLKMGITNIGSAKNNDIVINHASISPQHAQVTFGPDGFTIFDYNTPTGLHVNGKKVIEHLMNSGDELMIGEVQLRFDN